MIHLSTFCLPLSGPELANSTFVQLTWRYDYYTTFASKYVKLNYYFRICFPLHMTTRFSKFLIFFMIILIHGRKLNGNTKEIYIDLKAIRIH